MVQSREPRLAKAFFERFYPWCRAHGIEIEEGMCCSAQATPAGLQPRRGCARWRVRVHRPAGSFLGSVCNGRRGFACVVWGTGPVLGVIGVIWG